MHPCDTPVQSPLDCVAGGRAVGRYYKIAALYCSETSANIIKSATCKFGSKFARKLLVNVLAGNEEYQEFERRWLPGGGW